MYKASSIGDANLRWLCTKKSELKLKEAIYNKGVSTVREKRHIEL